MTHNHLNKNSKSNTQRLFYIFWSLVFATAFILMFVTGDYGLYQIYVLNKQTKNIEYNIHELRMHQDSLLVKKKMLEEDIKYIEKLARERYRMAKKGEKVFKVIENNK